MLLLARLEKDEEGSRGRIMRLLRQTPGMNMLAVAKATGLSWTTTRYHLKRLVAEGAVELVKRGRRDLACFPVGIPDKFRPWIATLRDPKTSKVWQALNQDAGVREVARRAGVSESAARRRLERLRASGAVSKRGFFRPVFSRNPEVEGNQETSLPPRKV